MQFRVSYLMVLLCVILGLTFKWWAMEAGELKGNNVITALIGLVAVYLSVFAIMQSLNDTDYNTCLGYLQVIEEDLNKIDFTPIFEGTPELWTKLTEKQRKELNGMEFQHLYLAFFNFLNNNEEYKEHLKNKDNVETYNFYHKIIDMYYYLINKHLYSFNEIIVVIKTAEESKMTKLQKKFIFRKIRRMCFKYYYIMNTKKQGHGGMIATQENNITDFRYDIPFYEEESVSKRETWRKTTLFKKYEYDKLYKVLIEHKTIGKGFNAAEERHQ